MAFKHNCTKFYLLSNKPIRFIDEEKNIEFEIILPNLFLLNTDSNLAMFINLLEKDISEIQKIISVSIKGYYDFIHLIFSLKNTVNEFNIMSNQILSALKLLNKNFIFDSVLKIGNIVITENIFNLIINCLFMSLDKEITIINKDDDEFTRMEKEAKIRAEKIRRNSKKEDKGNSFEDIIISILYEFQQYKIEDILSMNLYTFYYLFKYVGRIANYEVSKIAAGNGLAKKHKYFIEK